MAVEVGVPAYLILTLERTGSNLLCHALRGISGAGVPGEWFGYTDLHARAEEVGATLPSSTMEAPVLASLGAYVEGIAARQAAHNGAYGAKVHRYQYLQLRDDGLAADLLDLLPGGRRSDARVVLLVREDRRRQAISVFLARNTGVYAITRDIENGDLRIHKNPFWPGPLVEADDDPVPVLESIHAKIVEDEEDWKRWLREGCDLPTLEVSYESLTEDYAETVARVAAHVADLDVEPAAVPSMTFEKQRGEETERLLRLWVRDSPAPLAGGDRE